MNYKSKKAFSLLELIVVIFIGSTIIIYSSIYSKEYYEAEYSNQKLAVLKLDLNSARIIIEKNLPASQNQLSYENQKLYFKIRLLLDKVTKFSKQKTSSVLKIDLEVDDKIEQTWEFSL